jgi:hypothetical protein
MGTLLLAKYLANHPTQTSNHNSPAMEFAGLQTRDNILAQFHLRKTNQETGQDDHDPSVE